MAACDRWKQTSAPFASLTVPDIDSCIIWPNFCSANGASLASLPLECIYFRLFAVDSITLSLLAFVYSNRAVMDKAAGLCFLCGCRAVPCHAVPPTTEPPLLKRASHVVNQLWKPQHNPAKLSADQQFTLSYAVFHPQGIMLTYPYGTRSLNRGHSVYFNNFNTILLPKLLSSQADKWHDVIHCNDLMVLDIVGGLHV